MKKFEKFKKLENMKYMKNIKNTLEKVKLKFREKEMFVLGILISISVLIVDQITKHSAMSLIESIILKTNGIHTHIRKTAFFNLVLVWNRGISFGLFNNSNVFITTIILTIITAAILYIMYILWKNQNKIQIFCFSLVLGGAVGNVMDRFIYGAVIDFIDIHLGNLHWPAFNVADSCICVGILVYLLDEFLRERKNRKSDVKDDSGEKR